MARSQGYAGGPAVRYLVLFATMFLVCAGALMVFSAASAADVVRFGDGAHHLRRHLLGVGVGLVLMVVAMSVDYRRVRWMGPALLCGAIVGLVVVLFDGVGKWGATRWIDLGPVTVQPSEFAKIGCVLVAVLLLSQYRTGHITQTQLWLRLILAVGLPSGLILLQPDLGTTISIVAAVYCVLLIGGVRGRWLVGIAIAGLAGILALVVAAPYRARRLQAFLDPWADPQGAGYQSIQSMLAFGSGALDGVGLGLSRQKFAYLPAAHTDFIFAIIGEEFGLMGTLPVVAAFAVLAYAGVRIALGCRDYYGRVVAGGITAMLLIQAIMNMAAVTGLMPITGITLPLVSYGNSSMVLSLMSIGVILSVSRYGARVERRAHLTTKENVRANHSERRWDRRPHLSSIDGGRTHDRRWA